MAGQARMKSPLDGIEPVLAKPIHPVWADIAPRNGKPGFTPDEFNLPYEMDAHFLYWLYRCRLESPVPFRIISDARPAGRGASKSAHMERPCRAVDLQAMNSYERAVILGVCIRHGCVRWGTYPGDAKDKGGVHVDCSVKNPSPRAWTRW